MNILNNFNILKHIKMPIPADIEKKVISLFWKNPPLPGRDNNNYRFTNYGDKIYSVSASSKINPSRAPVTISGFKLVDYLRRNADDLGRMDTFNSVSPYLIKYGTPPKNLDEFQFKIIDIFFEDSSQQVYFVFDFHYDRFHNVCEIEAFDKELEEQGVKSTPITVDGRDMINRLYRNAVKQGVVKMFVTDILPHLTETTCRQ
jgi:hypothetical protein